MWVTYKLLIWSGFPLGVSHRGRRFISLTLMAVVSTHGLNPTCIYVLYIHLFYTEY